MPKGIRQPEHWRYCWVTAGFSPVSLLESPAGLAPRSPDTRPYGPHESLLLFFSPKCGVFVSDRRFWEQTKFTTQLVLIKTRQREGETKALCVFDVCFFVYLHKQCRAIFRNTQCIKMPRNMHPSMSIGTICSSGRSRVQEKT